MADFLYNILNRSNWAIINKNLPADCQVVSLSLNLDETHKQTSLAKGSIITYVKYFTKARYLTSQPYGKTIEVNLVAIQVAFNTPPVKPVLKEKEEETQEEGREPVARKKSKSFKVSSLQFETLLREMKALHEEVSNLQFEIANLKPGSSNVKFGSSNVKLSKFSEGASELSLEDILEMQNLLDSYRGEDREDSLAGSAVAAQPGVFSDRSSEGEVPSSYSQNGTSEVEDDEAESMATGKTSVDAPMRKQRVTATQPALVPAVVVPAAQSVELFPGLQDPQKVREAELSQRSGVLYQKICTEWRGKKLRTAGMCIDEQKKCRELVEEYSDTFLDQLHTFMVTEIYPYNQESRKYKIGATDLLEEAFNVKRILEARAAAPQGSQSGSTNNTAQRPAGRSMQWQADSESQMRTIEDGRAKARTRLQAKIAAGESLTETDLLQIERLGLKVPEQQEESAPKAQQAIG